MGLFSKKKVCISGLLCLAGLDIPENAPLIAKLEKEQLVLTALNKSYNISLDEIEHIECSIDVDIEKYQKSSTVKAIAGGALFGVTGAVIGATPKTKTKNNVSCCLFISLRNGNLIIVKDKISNSRSAAKLHDSLKKVI